MDHKEPPSTSHYRRLVAEFLAIGCSEKQVIGMLIHQLEQLSKRRVSDNRYKQP